MATSILVTGATGKQGSAVIDALVASSTSQETSILALTRNPDSGSAKALILKAPNRIKLLRGDLNDCSEIFTAAADTKITEVFCVSIPGFGAKSKEEENGKALVDAALQHGVEHFVLTSVDRHGSDSDATDTDIPHFISKANIEKHLRQQCEGTKMTWTILRPVAFMDNITTGFAGKIFPTAWKNGLSPTTKLQVVSTTDIGYFAAQALIRPREFAGRAISLAGDELTFDEANAIFRNKTGSELPTTYGVVSTMLQWAIHDVGLMFKWFEKVGYAADINGLRKEHPSLMSFEKWIETKFMAAGGKK